MKEEEDEEEEMDDEEEEEDEDQDQDQDQDQEQSQELVKKPVEDADKMEESDTRDDLPSTIADEKKETKEEDKVSEPPSEETEEVFSQTLKRDEIIDTVMQTPVVEPEIKKIFTSESSSSGIASEGLISIKDVEKKIPTTPTLKKEVKDEYEFDDDASRESTDVKDYMMSRSDRRKFSLSENVSSPVVSGKYAKLSSHQPITAVNLLFPFDDPEAEKAHRVWKRSIMLLWNDIAAHKNASIFLKPITEDKVPGYHSIVYRPMDLMTIKRNIENGSIRTTSEFQRDLLLMFLNAKMYNTRNHNIFRMAQDMLNDAVETLEEFIQAQMLAKVVETPQKSLRRETRESSAKRGVDDLKRKRDDREEKTPKRRKV
ncbi:Bromodomain-containing protein 8 [Armadillidium nasatum]|uniref:Bromodomain-containing protein 8 n=1 Tax=Armadillidium nasatum TaxID=96803 RepID=A0A5N5TJ72_9CRUS|nr:Bromodomain-containing protein 8 [Armadillidium nasatum]